jgi:hypothetical protein
MISTSTERGQTAPRAALQRIGASFKHVAQGWLTWVSLGAFAGILMFSPVLESANQLQSPDPSGSDIERAVAEAEKQGEAARAGQFRP